MSSCKYLAKLWVTRKLDLSQPDTFESIAGRCAHFLRFRVCVMPNQHQHGRPETPGAHRSRGAQQRNLAWALGGEISVAMDELASSALLSFAEYVKSDHNVVRGPKPSVQGCPQQLKLLIRVCRIWRSVALRVTLYTLSIGIHYLITHESKCASLGVSSLANLDTCCGASGW